MSFSISPVPLLSPTQLKVIYCSFTLLSHIYCSFSYPTPLELPSSFISLYTISCSSPSSYATKAPLFLYHQLFHISFFSSFLYAPKAPPPSQRLSHVLLHIHCSFSSSYATKAISCSSFTSFSTAPALLHWNAPLKTPSFAHFSPKPLFHHLLFYRDPLLSPHAPLSLLTYTTFSCSISCSLSTSCFSSICHSWTFYVLALILHSVRLPSPN